MTFTDMYLCVVGSIILKLLINDIFTYLLCCAMLGFALGAIKGKMK